MIHPALPATSLLLHRLQYNNFVPRKFQYFCIPLCIFRYAYIIFVPGTGNIRSDLIVPLLDHALDASGANRHVLVYEKPLLILADALKGQMDFNTTRIRFVHGVRRGLWLCCLFHHHNTLRCGTTITQRVMVVRFSASTLKGQMDFKKRSEVLQEGPTQSPIAGS